MLLMKTEWHFRTFCHILGVNYEFDECSYDLINKITRGCHGCHRCKRWQGSGNGHWDRVKFAQWWPAVVIGGQVAQTQPYSYQTELVAPLLTVTVSQLLTLVEFRDLLALTALSLSSESSNGVREESEWSEGEAEWGWMWWKWWMWWTLFLVGESCRLTGLP